MAVGNLLWQAGGPDAAAKAFAGALDAAPRDPRPRIALGHALSDAGKHQEALETLEPFANSSHAEGLACLANAYLSARNFSGAALAAGRARRSDPCHALAWYIEGNALAGLHRHEEALAALDQAAVLKPGIAQIEEARARAAVNCGRPDRAEAAWSSVLARTPDHAPALEELAKLYWMKGDPGAAEAMFAEALAARPGSVPILMEKARFLRAAQGAEAALAVLRTPALDAVRPALALRSDLLRETGDLAEAVRTGRSAFDPNKDGFDHALPLIRALLASGCAEEAGRLCTEARARQPDRRVWQAYALTAAKACRDGHQEPAAFDYDRHISLCDLTAPDGYGDIDSFNAALSETLLNLHRGANHPLDQSLRGGTQTLEPLHRLDDPLLRLFFTALRPAIDAHIRKSDRIEKAENSTGTPRDWRITGSWSVCLHTDGHHVDHIHDADISAVYYVSLPSDLSGGAGHLRFGKPPVNVPGCETADFVVAPVPGRLVLFPSHLWHGTEPFQDPYPRLTVAFDIALT